MTSARRAFGIFLKVQDASLTAPHAKSPILKQRLRFSLKTLFVALTLVAVWLGWNVSIVRKRDRLRAMIEDRPGFRGTIAVVTHAEGDASAPREVKERIAPYISAAFDIRNRGGRTIGPKESGNLSLVRRWLGDEPVFLILLDEGVDIRQFEAAFPEAMIVVRERSNR